MSQDHKSVFSRCAEDSFETIYFCNYIEECGCEVFSITINRNGQYEIWAKYNTSAQIIDIDQKISDFLNRLPRQADVPAEQEGWL